MSRFTLLCFVFLAVPVELAAQQFQVAAQVAALQSFEFDASEVGAGGRFAWHPFPVLGIESEINLYPGDFPDRHPFSGSRLEGLFGVTAGPRFARARLFARARAGLLRYSPAPEPFPCVAIFPPPLNCLMATGGTRPVVDLGGGLDIFTGAKGFMRIDIGDRMVRYPGPALVGGLSQVEDGFFGHDFRFALGGGLRF